MTVVIRLQEAQALDRLHDLATPEPVSWMPQTAGWYVLLLLAVIGLLWFAGRLVRLWKANRYRTAALAELAQIEELARKPESRSEALTGLPVLVKRTALSFAGRTQVAALHGGHWLRFLDSCMGGTEFTQGPGRLLIDLSYLPADRLAALEADDVAGLLTLVRRWISRHRSPSPPSASHSPSVNDLEVKR